MRKLLIGEEAKKFYVESTSNSKYTCFGESHRGIGGYYQSEYPNIIIAYDFTNGEEVFIEEFDDVEEAKKYAMGIEARTKDGLLI